MILYLPMEGGQACKQRLLGNNRTVTATAAWNATLERMERVLTHSMDQMI